MSTQKINFPTLSLKDALDLAVLIENEAQDRYGEFADQMEKHDTPEAAQFFRFMAQNEAKHGADLADRRKKMFGTASVAVDRSMIFDIEAPDYDQARAFMSAHGAMRAALVSEIKAHDFFSAVLPQVRDPEAKKLFEELRDEELEHKGMVERELAKLPPENKLDQSDLMDDPTPQ